MRSLKHSKTIKIGGAGIAGLTAAINLGSKRNKIFMAHKIGVKKYKNFKETFERIVKKDKEYILIKHRLDPNDKIQLHYHKKANEWVIIDNGKFKVKLGEKEKIFNLTNQAASIYFPRKQKHALSALSPISYFVLRDYKDKSHYCKPRTTTR